MLKICTYLALIDEQYQILHSYLLECSFLEGVIFSDYIWWIFPKLTAKNQFVVIYQCISNMCVVLLLAAV